MKMQMAVGALVCALLLSVAVVPAGAMAQENVSSSQRQEETTMDGTVVSTSRNTLVVRTDENQFQLFIFDQYTNRPRGLAAGARVQVVSVPGEESGARIARNISVDSSATSSSAAGPGTSSETNATVQTGSGAKPPAPVPPEVRDLESDIRRQAKRWRLGVRAGAGLDPELLLFGVHSQMGPIFSRNVIFRPNAEFAFGEITDLIALNLEAIYRLPFTARRVSWTPYVGAGPGFTFLHQSFHAKGEGRNIDFGNFDFDPGFNILAGAQFRRGTFVELKTSLYSRPAPTFRIIFGYNF